MVYHHPDNFVRCRMLAGIRLCRLGRLCFYHIELSRSSHSFGCRPTLCTPSFRIALRDELVVSYAVIPPPSFLSYSSRLLYSLHLPFTPSPLPLHLVYLLHIVTTLLFIVLAIVNVAISLGSSHPPLHSDGSPSPNLGAFPSYITSPVDCNITPVLRSRTEPSPPAACGCACHVRHRPRTPLRATISSLASAGRTSFFGTLILVS